MAETIRPHLSIEETVATIAAIALAVDALPEDHPALHPLRHAGLVLQVGLAQSGHLSAQLPAHAFAAALAAESIRPDS